MATAETASGNAVTTVGLIVVPLFFLVGLGGFEQKRVCVRNRHCRWPVLHADEPTDAEMSGGVVPIV